MKEMLNIEAAIAVVEYLSKNNDVNQNAANTIRQIAKEIKINHMTVTRTIKRLAAMKAVSLQKIGPSYAVKLNKIPEVFGFLALANSYKTGKVKQTKGAKEATGAKDIEKDVDQIIAKTKQAYERIE